MRRFGLFMLVIIAFSSVLFSQGNKSLKLDLDIASYRYDDEKSFVEIYYAFSRSALQFTKESDGFHASVLMRSLIQETPTTEPIMKVWRVPVFLPDTTLMQNKSMVGKVNYILAPIRYHLTFIAQDEKNINTTDTAILNFETTDYSKSHALFSDIELCSSLQHIDPDTTNIFYKNTLEAVPNPSLIYGMDAPVLLYYVELYNCKLDAYKIRAEIINAYGRTVAEKNKSKASAKKNADASQPVGIIDYGALPIHTFPSNIYTLVLTLQDTSGKSIASQTKRFYIYNPSRKPDTIQYAENTADQIAPEFADLPEDELDKEFLQASYIATKSEKDKWKELHGSEAKKKFLTRFWKAQDADLSTPENEFQIEYRRRVQLANQDFRTAYRQGWQTDRGRVFILYGKPDAIDRFASESDTKPYQIWTYDNIEGGVQFVFIDRFGFNNYELVHSTKRNELHDELWRRFIQTN